MEEHLEAFENACFMKPKDFSNLPLSMPTLTFILMTVKLDPKFTSKFSHMTTTVNQLTFKDSELSVELN